MSDDVTRAIFDQIRDRIGESFEYQYYIDSKKELHKNIYLIKFENEELVNLIFKETDLCVSSKYRTQYFEYTDPNKFDIDKISFFVSQMLIKCLVNDYKGEKPILPWSFTRAIGKLFIISSYTILVFGVISYILWLFRVFPKL